MSQRSANWSVQHSSGSRPPTPAQGSFQRRTPPSPVKNDVSALMGTLGSVDTRKRNPDRLHIVVGSGVASGIRWQEALADGFGVGNRDAFKTDGRHIGG